MTKWMSLLGLIILFAACGGPGTTVRSGGQVSSGVTAPAITGPESQTVAAGAAATFSVAATGSAPLSYQWKNNGTGIAGATGSTYSTPATTLADNGETFAVTVMNSAGSVTSGTVTLTVNPPAAAPSIGTQPSNQTVTIGQSATFSVAASGTAPLSYQWQRNGAAIPGATATSYTTAATASGDNGATFQVIVTNATGSATSTTATLTVNASAAAPAITTQPSNQSVTAGRSATFAVAASGSAPLTYQWQKNGSSISGATASSYITPATSTGDNGASFAVVVSNSAGSVMSKAAQLSVTASTGTDVLTYHNDNSRTGQNLTETQLTTANVNSSHFGLLRILPADGLVDGQPLIVSGLTVNGTSRNVVFVVTENDSVYSYDADSGAALLHVSVVAAGETASDDRNCDQVTPQIGITSTPVIDRAAGPNGTLYLVAMSKDSSGNYYQRLHALDLVTLAERPSSPVTIQATFPGTGNFSNGTVTFQASQYEERAALVLVNGSVYTAWASHCDITPYFGWVIGYNEISLAQTQVVNLAPNGLQTSIWQSGGGMAADSSGNLFALLANGTFDTTLTSAGFPSQGDYGNAFVKMSTTNSLQIADYFDMDNTVLESSQDTDLGSGAPMLLPDQSDATGVVRHLAVGAGKDGHLYVVNRDNMGKFSMSNNAIWEDMPGVLPGGIWATPAYFQGTVYYGDVGGTLKAFGLANALLGTTPTSKTTMSFGYPGVAPAISANGASSGIVWVVENGGSAVLHAFNAGNLAVELYNSNQAQGGRDSFGHGNKFITPVIANGKVFVGTPSGVGVFGLLP